MPNDDPNDEAPDPKGPNDEQPPPPVIPKAPPLKGDADANGLKDKPPLTIYDHLARWGLLLIALCCVVAAILHAFFPGNIDQTTGIFLGLAAAVLVIREVTRIETPWFKLEKKVKEELEKAKDELTDKAKEEVKQIVEQVMAKAKELEKEVKQVDKQVGVIQERGLPGSKQATPKSQRTKKVTSRTKAATIDPDDPNKGQFGGSPINNKQHRRLQAKVEDIVGRNRLPCEVTFWVESTDEEKHPLDEGGAVTFHLHPSFGQWATYSVEVEDGRAEDEITSWGSFTLGAVCTGSDGKECKLELELAKLPGVSPIFKDS